MNEYPKWDKEAHEKWRMRGATDYYHQQMAEFRRRMGMADTIDIPYEIVEDKQLPATTETPKP